ncbi:SDR family oxidoreductase [Aspergillus mulundensis]|uniref:Short chain dehydrogenase family oxidoreductase (JCVI) n=1 Tax=Aspergillus mulundensis TaxID=1810919 RepID=A0A3D8RRB1_9EURO|nr:Short chain dehydrogenase family oxidoreductase (JCVI) [Aspergillus mulundensis]RDW76331.1 Short chain dehydrogenase family oxidoreductase (JCVI) [Aspergillus mulundensis]
MSTTTANTVYLITGANRGLGLGLVKSLLTRPSTTIIASVRNEEASATLKSELSSITPSQNSTVHIILLSFSADTPTTPSQILNTLATIQNITHIDVLIANAGFAAPMTPALHTTAPDLRSSFETNTIAPLLVFQAIWPLLKSAKSAPKAVFMSSSVGCISAQEPFPGGAYGASRAAGNWLTRAIHLQHEEDGLVAFAMHPGWVRTRAGEFVAREWGVEGGPPESVENSVKGVLEVVDGATRERVGGRFVTYKGEELPW